MPVLYVVPKDDPFDVVIDSADTLLSLLPSVSQVYNLLSKVLTNQTPDSIRLNVRSLLIVLLRGRAIRETTFVTRTSLVQGERYTLGL